MRVSLLRAGHRAGLGHGLRVERHRLLPLVEGGTKPLALALQLGDLLIDVQELAEVVAGLGTQRADPQVGQVQLGPGLVLELVEGALGQELELADQAAGRKGGKAAAKNK